MVLPWIVSRGESVSNRRAASDDERLRSARTIEARRICVCAQKAANKWVRPRAMPLGCDGTCVARGEGHFTARERITIKRNSMKVQQAMTTLPVCCNSTDSMNAAARIMWDHDCGFVPVIDDDAHVVGILTDRDALMAAYTRGQSLDEIPVTVAMSADVIGCRPEDDVGRAEALMRQHQVRRLIVTDDADRLIGVLSLNDLASHGAPRLELAETLSTICASRRQAHAAQ